MERFAIIGFGCAGYHALRAIREAGCDAIVDVYSDTDMPPYNPMLTTYYTAGRLPYEGLFPFGSLDSIARQYKANVITHTRVASVDAAAKTVTTQDGGCAAYDKILVTTGATAFVPGSFASLKGAFCMRTVDDAVKLHDAIAKRDYKDAVIVGASMVGIKVAELLHKRGCHVTLADMAPHIFALAAYPEVSEMIEARLEKMGIDMVFGKAIAGAVEHTDAGGNITGTTVQLADGSAIETELLVLNIGTRAATGPAADSHRARHRRRRADAHLSRGHLCRRRLLPGQQPAVRPDPDHRPVGQCGCAGPGGRPQHGRPAG